MNILKQIKILGLILVPACLMGMDGVHSIQMQPNVLSAVELGLILGMRENQKDFVIPISGGGSVKVRLDSYEHEDQLNSFRDRKRRSRPQERHKISIVIDGVRLNSLDFLSQVFASNEADKTFFCRWLYNLSVHNSDLVHISGSWFAIFDNLETLDLSGNRIIGFDAVDFRLPVSLKVLSLAENNIQIIPTTLFQQELQWLECLNLSRNHINQLDSEMFSGLLFLNTLNLSNNAIEFLPNGLFHKVGSLYPHFILNINLCNNPILSSWRQVIMENLGFNKRNGNKIVFEKIDDGQSTPREICLRL